ncbi:hypothetical protein [Oceanobacillus saliphilus]|uniref:hypothetical protein n=1 Tax=Oceanobacillus saliphilus TaxID=2925834 RepID=UPI00201D8A5A|nr:hypothetical protein [Oceanobacillus saliphilus]
MNILFLLLLFIPTVSYSAETEPKDTIVIDTYQEDLTGDGDNEKIELKGILFSQDAQYYQNIWTEISSASGPNWSINYGGGYDPQLQFIDLNHDKVKDIFYQSPTGGSGGLYSYNLQTLAKGDLKELELPKQHYVKGMFEDNFIVSIDFVPEGQPDLVDVRDRADDYIRLGIYDKSGALLKSPSLMIDPIAFFEPVKISTSKGYGLKSYQQISGAYHADRLGSIKTIWYYENEKWLILKTEWIPARL